MIIDSVILAARRIAKLLQPSEIQYRDILARFRDWANHKSRNPKLLAITLLPTIDSIDSKEDQWPDSISQEGTVATNVTLIQVLFDPDSNEVVKGCQWQAPRLDDALSKAHGGKTVVIWE